MHCYELIKHKEGKYSDFRLQDFIWLNFTKLYSDLCLNITGTRGNRLKLNLRVNLFA